MIKKNVIIIGGGIVGSTAAFYLSQQKNLNVTLIDHGVGTATRAAAGIICPWLAQKKNKDWYRLTSTGAVFYRQLKEDVETAGGEQFPFKQTGTVGLKSHTHLLEKIQKLATERRADTPAIGRIQILEKEELQGLLPLLKPDFYGVFLEGGGRVDGGKLIDILQDIFRQNGGRLLKGKAKLLDAHTVAIHEETIQASDILLATGAWLPELLEPLGYQVDVRPQKGQLFELDTDFASDDWPVCMPYGQIDILPFEDGRIIVGASHEDQMGYDLQLDWEKIQEMREKASQFMPVLGQYQPARTRIGTRAYTSTYSPFYGALDSMPSVWVASGLGSSGLTNGPFIGWQLAQAIAGISCDFDASPYDPTPYIQKQISPIDLQITEPKS